jgi:enoyl-[acyl-carrier protein] reductase I
MIQNMIAYSELNAPIQAALQADDVGNTAAFLCSDLARGITGSVVYVDNGMHAMGMAVPASYNESV